MKLHAFALRPRAIEINDFLVRVGKKPVEISVGEHRDHRIIFGAQNLDSEKPRGSVIISDSPYLLDIRSNEAFKQAISFCACDAAASLCTVGSIYTLHPTAIALRFMLELPDLVGDVHFASAAINNLESPLSPAHELPIRLGQTRPELSNPFDTTSLTHPLFVYGEGNMLLSIIRGEEAQRLPAENGCIVCIPPEVNVTIGAEGQGTIFQVLFL